MSTLDELELEMYRSAKDWNYAEEFGDEDDYIEARLHYAEASRMFVKAQIRQAKGQLVDNKKTKKWLKECREKGRKRPFKYGRFPFYIFERRH